MKKQLLTLSAASLCSLSAMAQQSGSLIPIALKDYAAKNKTTGVESRMVGFASWHTINGTPTPQDSAYFVYSPNNGWDPLFGSKCDTGFILTNTGTGYTLRGRIIQAFDPQKRGIMRVKEDLVGNSFMPSVRELFTYNSDGRLATKKSEFFINGSATDSVKTLYAYDVQGRVTETIEQIDATGTWENNHRSINAYNAQGAISGTTDYEWKSGQWEPLWRKTNYYSGANNHLTVFERFESSAWVDHDSTFNTYDTNGLLIESETKRQYNGLWKNEYKYIYTYDASGNTLSFTLQNAVSGTYENSSQTTYTYNSFNQPLTLTGAAWNATTGQFDIDPSGQNFYYEQFTSSVNDTHAAKAGAIKVYPMPAANTITLDLNWSEAQPAAIMLFDMTGKLAGQWTTPTAKQRTQALDISNIPSGTYMLKVMGTKGVLSKQVNIVR